MNRTISFLTLCAIAFTNGLSAQAHFATGVKVGEVTHDSVRLWARLTEKPGRNADGTPNKEKGKRMSDPELNPDSLEGACPGAAGRISLTYQKTGDEPGAVAVSTWAAVDASTDFAHTFHLQGLAPASEYTYFLEGTREKALPEVPSATIEGRFRTAPTPVASATVTFTVITGQMYVDSDRVDGFHIYPSMQSLNPDFLVATGDTVYYDNEAPVARSIPLARHHWNRMYSLSTLRDFHRGIPGYWIKDDHDTHSNDCWPGYDPEFMRPLTFAEGQKIFLEEVPMGDKTHRTFRWGRHLQIWLPEGRDFRSPNTDPDGPEKTIWGREQIEWLAASILESDADWKVLISATPIVGPDRSSKADNHSNQAFAHEGNEIREWIRDHASNNLFVVCGDRHWQYHSIDPKTGIQEFSCGPASDVHAGGVPDDATDEYRFLRVLGGFLSVSVEPEGERSQITFRHHDVAGTVVHEWSPPLPAATKE